MPNFPFCCTLPSANHTLDSEEFIEKSNTLLQWRIPKVPTSKLYPTSNPFRLFSSNTSIKTAQGTFSIGNGGAAIRLLHENPLGNCFTHKKFYATFNIGLIQIGVKALTTKIPPDASITLCICDTRREKLEESLLGLVEAKLGSGPFYLNVFPNITMSIFEPRVLDAVTAEAIVEGFEELPKGAKPISLTYRVCYKLQSGCEPSALLESPEGKTVFFQTEVGGSNETVQRVSMWDEVISKVASADG